MNKNIFIFVILFSAFACNLVYAQKYNLIDDFEDGDTQSKIAGIWLAGTDEDDGGNSWGNISVVTPGYHSKRAMRFDYNLGQKFIDANSGEFKEPYALLALMMNKKAFQAKDFRQYMGFRFCVKGKGAYSCFLLDKIGDNQQIFYSNFEIKSSRWKLVTLKFANFQPLAGGEEKKLDLAHIILMGIGKRESSQGSFLIDDAKGVLRKKKSIAQKMRLIRFGYLDIQKPEDWKWESTENYQSKLTCDEKATGIVFLGIPMVDRNRIPFSDGLSADPGNTKELMECTLHELQKWGFRDIRPLRQRKVRLRYFKTRKFTFVSGINSKIAKDLRNIGISGDRVFLRVDFIKYRSTTYELITYMPEELKKEMLPITSNIINNLGKHK